MSSENREDRVDQASDSVEQPVSQNRRDAITKLAYGSPAIAALLLSKSAAAQASPPTFTPPAPP